MEMMKGSEKGSYMQKGNAKNKSKMALCAV